MKALAPMKTLALTLLAALAASTTLSAAGEPATPGTPRLDSPIVDALALDVALTRLQALDPRQVEIVELRYFAGLEVEEVAELLGLSPTTVKRESAMARAFLTAQLG